MRESLVRLLCSTWNSHGSVQEAMASFAHKIKKKLNILMDIFLTSAMITQNHSKMLVFSLKTSGKHPFLFCLLLRGKCIDQKSSTYKPCQGHTQKIHTKVAPPKWACWRDKHTELTSVFYVSSSALVLRYIHMVRISARFYIAFSSSNSFTRALLPGGFAMCPNVWPSA